MTLESLRQQNSNSSQNPVQGTPERNLLMATLERALLDYVGNNNKDKEEAKAWLFSKAGVSQIFSLEWICEQLDLDINMVKNTVRNMPMRGNKKMAPWYFPEYKAA